MSSTVWRIKHVRRLKRFSLHDEVSPASRGERGGEKRGAVIPQGTGVVAEHVEASGQVPQSERRQRRRYSRLIPSCIYSFTTGVSLWAHAVTASCKWVHGHEGVPRYELTLPQARLGNIMGGRYRWRQVEARNSCWPQTQHRVAGRSRALFEPQPPFDHMTDLIL